MMNPIPRGCYLHKGPNPVSGIHSSSIVVQLGSLHDRPPGMDQTAAAVSRSPVNPHPLSFSSLSSRTSNCSTGKLNYCEGPGVATTFRVNYQSHLHHFLYHMSCTAAMERNQSGKCRFTVLASICRDRTQDNPLLLWQE